MTVPVILPQLGMAMTEGKLVEFLVEDGASVTEGQPIFSIENDKATNDVEAPASGRIRFLGQLEETYPVETLIAEITP